MGQHVAVEGLHPVEHPLVDPAGQADPGTDGGRKLGGHRAGLGERQAARGVVQQGQLARLREGVTVPVVELPHLTSPAVEPADVERLAELLADV